MWHYISVIWQSEMEDKEQCIICTQKPGKDDHLVSPETGESWQTFLEAAKIRSHDPVMDIVKHQVEKEIPKIYYHRKCRSIFAMKRD